MKKNLNLSLAAYTDVVFAIFSVLLFLLILGLYVYEARQILAHVNASLTVPASAQQVTKYNVTDAQKIDYRGLLR